MRWWKILDINNAILNKTIFQSNTSGPFIILQNIGNINGRNKILIQFINTGFVCETILYNALDGRVSDKTLNRINTDYSINRFIDYESHINNLLKVMYSHMVSRCYNKSDKKYNAYGKIGVRVCNNWLNSIDSFLNDVRLIDGFDKYYNKPFMYSIDKDYKQMHLPKSKRIYSKDTCIFLSIQDNTNLKCIENKINGITKYYGVEINSAGNFYARIKVNGRRINIGTFNNEIAAANAFNYFQNYYHTFELIPLINDVPYMPPNEFIKYNLNIKNLCNNAIK